MLKSLLYRGTVLLDRALGHLPAVGCFRPIRGSFSAWERLRGEKLAGGVIAGSQPPGPCPPGSITELAGMRQHDYQPWPVFWARADDARLVGAMLHWRDPRDLICTEGVFHIPQRRRLSEDRFLAQIILPQPVSLPGAWTSIASNWADGKNYYHWITDGLTRLQVREHLPEETRILLPAETPSYIGETMQLLGLANLAQRAPAPCVRPERFYFCSPTAMTGVWNPMGFQWLRDQFRPLFSQPASGPPVFLTRRGGNRVPENLHDIETLFSRRGFAIVDCGKLSVKEQIHATSAAPAIAGFHGAAMTNLLWANPETPVLEIFSPGYLNACYEQISFHGGLRYTARIMSHPSDHQCLLDWCKEIR